MRLGPSSERLVWLAWPPLLVAWLFATIVPVGFAPLDEGYVLAQAYRVLHGQFPHRDIVSPRPLGSALIHVVDYAVPLPLIEASRLVAVVEITTYSLMFAALIYRLDYRRWGLLRSLGAAGSVLVNLQTFPLMAWYTIDGLLLVATGLVCVETGLGRGRGGPVRIGLAMLGAAVLVKQSFFLAPVLGVVRVAWAVRSEERRGALRTATMAALTAAVPLVLYVCAVAVAGGFAEMRRQLASAAPVYGTTLVWMLRIPPERSALLWRLGLGTAVLTGIRVFRDRTGFWAMIVDFALRMSLSVLVLYLVLEDGLLPMSRWASRVVWLLVVVTVWRGAVARTIDGAALALCATAWMTMLSWGHPVPDLVAGSAALAVLDRTWKGAGRIAPAVRRGVLAGALIASVLVARTFREARASSPYYDRPEPALTAPLRGIAAPFGRIRTNPTTAHFIDDLVACVRRYPARSVGAYPDDPWIYPALGLRNPLPLDWLYRPEIAGSEAQLLGAARRLDDRGDYLVLFQTVSGFNVARMAQLPAASVSSHAFAYGSRLGDEMLGFLHGERVTCGSFVGRYAAPRS